MSDHQELTPEMEAAWLRGYDGPDGEPDQAIPLRECVGDIAADSFIEGWLAARLAEHRTDKGRLEDAPPRTKRIT